VCKLLTNIKIDPSTNPTAEGGKENAKKYSKALKTKYANYIVTNCVSENLPSGVTIPKIPGQ
jgi:hypothetical protein